MTDHYDQREDLHAIRADTHEGSIHTQGAHTHQTDTHGPSVAICTMDANGRLRFGGSEGYVRAMITAIAERYCEGLAGKE